MIDDEIMAIHNHHGFKTVLLSLVDLGLHYSGTWAWKERQPKTITMTIAINMAMPKRQVPYLARANINYLISIIQ